MNDDYVSRQYLRSIMRGWYQNKDLQSAKDDPCVIDAMTDLALRTVAEAPAVDILEFTQEEKQLIWDALFFYQQRLYEESKSDHFANDIFAKRYNICVDLMTEKLDKYWDIMH